MLSRRLLVACLGTWLLPAAAAAPAERPFSVRVNGVRLEIVASILRGTPVDLARRLEGRWGERQAVPAHSSRPRTVLGRQRGPFHETLALSPGPRPGTSLAIVAVQDLRGRPAPLPPSPVPLPVDARMINVVQFGASRAGSATFTIDAPGAPGPALDRLWRAAAARGWQRLDAPTAVGLPGAAFWARRGVREIAVVAVPAGDHTRLVLLEAADGTEVLR